MKNVVKCENRTEREAMERCKMVHKENERFKFVLKDNLYKFLVESMGVKLKTSANKPELIEKAYELMTYDTIAAYSKMDRFGLTRKDISKILGVSEYMVNKLIQQKEIRKVGEYESRLSTKLTYYIYSMDDVIKLYPTIQVKPKKEPKEIEATDSNLAEALYLVNKSAKVSRNTKNQAYLHGRYDVCGGAKTRMLNLYFIKDAALEKLIEENRIEYMGIHKQELDNGESTYLKAYKLADFMFHVPCKDVYSRDVVNGTIQGVISEEKTRNVSLNFNEATKLLEKYTGKSASGNFPNRYYW